MASLDYRLNPIYTIKECSSCGSLYNKERCCSKGGFVDKFFRDPNKTPDSSQRPPQNYPKCGNPVDGLYCRQCALLRKKLKEVWSTICYEDEIFQDFLNTSESSNDKTNVVNAPQEPFVFNQDPGENSSQRPPHINHHCCYGCGDSLDGIFCQRCTCQSCRNGDHYGYNCPPKVPTISNLEPCHNQNIDEFPQTLPSLHLTCYYGDGSSFTYDSTPNFVDDSPNVFNPPSQPPTYSCEFCGNDAYYGYDCPPQIPIYYDDDDDEESSIPLRDIIISELPPCIAITPVLLTEEPVDSLIMEDKHLDTILETESDELIKSSVEDLVHTQSESDDISKSDDDESSHEEIIHEISFKTYLNPLFDLDEEIISSEFNLIHNENLDSIPKNDHFDTESYLLESLLNHDTLMASSPKIDSLFDEFAGELITIPPRIINREHEEYISLMEREEIDIFLGLDDSIPLGIESDDYDSEGDDNSTSLPEFESFHVDYLDSGDSTIDVVEGIPVDVPNILATHPTLS
ncbi:hypothetical protein Tco_1019248 [Tanacetum coccineum]|uniref:Uncharacterized protein n=1 Tax=Tanacetum coccineum TaxID=301880 RepID=A0ABQ5FWN2_9ASTR